MASTRALKPIQSGTLRFTGKLEKPTPGTDSKGLPLTTYELFADVRFDIQDYRSTESLNAQQMGSQVTTYVVMRYIPGVDASMRLVHVTDSSVSPPTIDYYDIQGIVKDPTGRRALQLYCIKRQAAGFRAGTPSG